MFEQMRESGTAWDFVLRADVIPDIYRDNRDVMILVGDDVKTV